LPALKDAKTIEGIYPSGTWHSFNVLPEEVLSGIGIKIEKVPDEENSAVWYLHACNRLNRLLSQCGLYDFDKKLHNSELREEMEEIVKELEEGNKREKFYFPITVFPDSSAMMALPPWASPAVESTVCLLSKIQAAEGKVEQALSTLEALAKFGSRISSEPFRRSLAPLDTGIQAYLFAMRGIHEVITHNSATLSDATIQGVANFLTQHPFAVQSPRRLALSDSRWWRYVLVQHHKMQRPLQLSKKIDLSEIPVEEINLVFDRYEQAVINSLPDMLSEQYSVDKVMEERKAFMLWLEKENPTLEYVFRIGAVTHPMDFVIPQLLNETLRSGLIIQLGLLSFAKINEHFPESEKQLSEFMEGSLPLDPFCGGNFKFKTTTQSEWVFYSVGPNQQDDGCKRQRSYNLYPESYSFSFVPLDVVFSLDVQGISKWPLGTE
jgi:hypothetical protein